MSRKKVDRKNRVQEEAREKITRIVIVREIYIWEKISEKTPLKQEKKSHEIYTWKKISEKSLQSKRKNHVKYYTPKMA